MADYNFVAGATSRMIDIFFESAYGVGKTGLAFNTATLVCYYHGDTDATETAVSLVTATVGTYTDSGFVKVSDANAPGVVQFGVPDAAIAAGGSVIFTFQGAVGMLQKTVEIQLSPVPANLTQIDGAATNGNNAVLNLKQLSIYTPTGEAVAIASDDSVAMHLYGGTGMEGLKSNGGAGGHGVAFESGSGSAIGLKLTGSGGGEGLEVLGGNLASGALFQGAASGIDSQGTSGSGIASSSASGAGLRLQGSEGLHIQTNLTSERAVFIQGGGDDLTAAGIVVTGGVSVTGPVTGDAVAIASQGGSFGNGISATGDSGGAGINVVGNPALSDSFVDAILDRTDGIEVGMTLRQALEVIASAVGAKLSGAGTTTVTIRNAVADSKDRITATVDSLGNRSAITYDLS